MQGEEKRTVWSQEDFEKYTGVESDDLGPRALSLSADFRREPLLALPLRLLISAEVHEPVITRSVHKVSASHFTEY